MEVDISGAKVFFTTPIDVPLLGELQISETLIVSWIVMALITGICFWLTRGLKVRNISKKQAAAEWIVETADKFVLGNMGEKSDRTSQSDSGSFYRGCMGSCGFYDDHSAEDKNKRCRRVSERIYHTDSGYDSIQYSF